MTINKLRAIFWRTRVIRRLLEAGHSVDDLVGMLRVSRRTIYHVQSDAKFWYHVLSTDYKGEFASPDLDAALEGYIR